MSLLSAGWSAPPAPLAGWSSYLDDGARDAFSWREATLTPATVQRLHVFLKLPSHGSVSGEPLVSGNHIYWGSWDGNVHATTTWGQALWSTNLGTSVASCDGVHIGAAAAGAITTTTENGKPTQILIVPGGDRKLYALNTTTGRVLWSRNLSPPNGGFLWSSPLVYHGSIYIGLASEGDCPLVQGKFFKLDAATGTIQQVLATVPNGCVGGSIWSSPTLDPGTGDIYLTTGNGGDCSSPEPLAEAMVEVSSSDLSVVGSWAVPQADQVYDSDFGATPTLFTTQPATGPTVSLVGAINKNGYYYGFQRGEIANGPVWQVKIGWGGSNPLKGGADISTSAWADNQVYVATGKAWVNGQRCSGSLQARDPATGAANWQICLSSPVIGAVILSPGLVYVSYGIHILAVSMIGGQIRFNGVIPGARFEGPSTVVQGMVLQGDMNGGLDLLRS